MSVKKIPSSEALENYNIHFRRRYFPASNEVHRLHKVNHKHPTYFMPSDSMARIVFRVEAKDGKKRRAHRLP